MSRRRSVTSGTFLLVALGAGCASLESPEALGVESSGLVAPNGVSLNGVSLNGVSLNGVSLNGVSLNGVSLNGVSLNGVSLNGVSLNGTSLHGTTPGDVLVSGVGLVGATFEGVLSNGQVVALRNDAVTSGSGVNADLSFYTVAFLGDAGWQPLCGLDAGGVAIAAIPLAGAWDYTQGTVLGGSHHDDAASFTFACRGTALAKCVEIGYRPWASVGGVALADYHQACTRMIRADYCGDGTPHTVNNTPINVYDGRGVQVDTASWGFEAEWRSDGARCVTGNRRGALTDPAACVLARVSSSCGAPGGFDTGTLVMNEYRPHVTFAGPSLGAAQRFAVLAASTVTSTGATTRIDGDVGVSPGTAITGLPADQPMNGSRYAGGAAAQAQADTTVAYEALVDTACATDLTGQDLGGLTLRPGVYCFASSAGLTGTLTLDAEGDPDAVFIFQMGSTLTTATDAAVALINGARACGVYWQVGSSATLGTGTALHGSILAYASITLTTDASVAGRALARTAAVTMGRNSAVAAARCE